MLPVNLIQQIWLSSPMKCEVVGPVETAESAEGAEVGMECPLTVQPSYK